MHLIPPPNTNVKCLNCLVDYCISFHRHIPSHYLWKFCQLACHLVPELSGSHLPPGISSSLTAREWVNRHLYPNLLPGFWTTSGTNGHRLESPGNRCELVWRVQKFIGRNTCERTGMETGLGRISVRPQCRCDKSLPVQHELWSKDHLQEESCKCPDPFTTSLCAYKLGAARGK